jgi:hypothetical protein
MARVNTNNTSLRFCTESSIGVAVTTGWRLAEFDTIGSYGATIATTVRRPISQDRGRRKGTVTDLDSAVEFETDLTMDAFADFAEGFMFAEFANDEFNLRFTGGLLPPTVASGTTFTVVSATTLLAGKVQWVTGDRATLLWAKGYTNAANNGLHVLTADLGAAGSTITCGGSSLVVETPPTNASLQVCGLRVLNDADLTLTIAGSGLTATLVSATAVSFTTLGLKVGQFIHIGSANPTTGVVQNGLGAGGVVSYGYARITAISATTLNLDKLSSTLGIASDVHVGPGAGASQDLLFGRFLRDVAVTSNSDDTRYLELSYQMEVTYPELGGVSTPEYEYAIGNFVNEVSITMPISDKATMSYSFIGTNSDDITPTRKTGPSSAVTPLRTTAVNTASNFAALSTDVISSVSDVCFKDLTLSIRNNVSPEKCLGTLGARFMNSGLFEVDLEGQMLFTSKDIVNAIKDNETVTFLAILKNEDGAVAFDIPEMTFGDGAREFPVDASVLVSITGQTFTSSTYGYNLGISLFPVVPWA